MENNVESHRICGSSDTMKFSLRSITGQMDRSLELIERVIEGALESFIKVNHNFEKLAGILALRNLGSEEVG